jgi:hypothetical protein
MNMLITEKMDLWEKSCIRIKTVDLMILIFALETQHKKFRRVY